MPAKSSVGSGKQSRLNKSHKRNRLKKPSAATVRVDRLESRVLFSTIVVNTLSDTGSTSLRGAIEQANSSNTSTTITFDPTVFATPQTITLSGTPLELTNTAHPTIITGPAVGVTVDANQQGAVFIVDQQVTASLSAITVTGGTSGGIANHGSLALSNVTVSNNVNSNDGGGIFNDGTLSLADCTLTQNAIAGGSNEFAHGGGGIYNAGSATFTDCTLSDNLELTDAASTGGGGLFNAGTATLTDCTIAGNSHGTPGVTNAGGLDVGAGIYNSGSLTLTGSTVSGNTSYNESGGMENTGNAVLVNSTFANNVGQDGAGAIRNSGTLSLTNVTISANQGIDGAGGLDSPDDPNQPVAGVSVTLATTIIAGNTGGADGTADVDILAIVTSQGHNLIGNADGSSGFVGSDLTGTAANPLDPALLPLAGYGGPTQTMVPGNGPAIDNGSNALIPMGVTTDQRGQPRVANGTVDIGAVEVQDQPGTTTTLTSSQTTVSEGDAVTLTATVAPVVSGGTTPTGSVIFTANGNALRTVALSSDGTAILTTSALPAGAVDVTAAYTGSTTYGASGSQPLTETVTPFSTPAPFGIVSHKHVRLAPITLDNGTVVTISIAGGSGTVAHVGNNLALTLSGAFSSVTLRTRGGANSLTLSTLSATGRISTLNAPTASFSGALVVDGKIGTVKLANITGTIQCAGIAHLTAASVTGAISCTGTLASAHLGPVTGTIAAARINTFVAASLSNAMILAGTSLGSDFAVGGVGTAADTYGPGEILTLRITGSVTASLIAAGANPGADGLFATSDDTFAAGKSRVGAITVQGTLDSATHFESPLFPRFAHLPNKVATAQDSRFIT